MLAELGFELATPGLTTRVTTDRSTGARLVNQENVPLNDIHYFIAFDAITVELYLNRTKNHPINQCVYTT